MYTFITDSIYHYQKNKDFIFKNDLYKWNIKNEKNEMIFNKKIMDRKNELRLQEDEIIAIISPSNYKLLFDLKELNVKKIYLPEFYEKGTILKTNYNDINKLFNNFLKRSYLSYLNYEKLQNIGLNRVEQYIIMLNIIAVSSFRNIDNLILNNKYKIINIEKMKSRIIKEKRISTIKAINLISLKYKISYDEASKFLIQQYGKLNISDPFHEDGFILLSKLDEYTELNKIFLTILKEEISVNQEKIILEDDKGNKKEEVINKLEVFDEDISNYFSYQKEDYFEGKYLIAINEINNLSFLYQNLKDILPLKDFLLTLKSLLKLNKINSFNTFFKIKSEDISKLKIKRNLSWISVKVWKDIYELDNFTFNNLLDEIYTDDLEFVCPCCGYTYYNITPMRFYCKNNNCNFVFDRLTLKVVEVKNILEDKMKEALVHKKVFIKNKNGKNFVAYLRNKDKYYYLSLK